MSLMLIRAPTKTHRLTHRHRAQQAGAVAAEAVWHNHYARIYSVSPLHSNVIIMIDSLWFYNINRQCDTYAKIHSFSRMCFANGKYPKNMYFRSNAMNSDSECQRGKFLADSHILK